MEATGGVGEGLMDSAGDSWCETIAVELPETGVDGCGPECGEGNDRRLDDVRTGDMRPCLTAAVAWTTYGGGEEAKPCISFSEATVEQQGGRFRSVLVSAIGQAWTEPSTSHAI